MIDNSQPLQGLKGRMWSTRAVSRAHTVTRSVARTLSPLRCAPRDRYSITTARLVAQWHAACMGTMHVLLCASARWAMAVRTAAGRSRPRECRVGSACVIAVAFSFLQFSVWQMNLWIREAREGGTRAMRRGERGGRSKEHTEEGHQTGRTRPATQSQSTEAARNSQPIDWNRDTHREPGETRSRARQAVLNRRVGRAHRCRPP